MKIACCILSYNITKGMKSFGPIGLLKKSNNTNNKELIIHQIEYLRKIFGSVDMYVMTGFGKDRMDKKITEKRSVNIVHNAEFNHKNYSYAFKLFLQTIQPKLDNYHGVFFLDANVLIKSLNNKKRNHSWIVTKPHKNHTQDNEDFLGVNINNGDTVEYLFYNIGNLDWCKSFYLTQNDMRTIIDNVHLYHDNMFLFEILNQSIEYLGIKFHINKGSDSKQIIKIKGIKDKHKVK